jgi:hypothetical protein
MTIQATHRLALFSTLAHAILPLRPVAVATGQTFAFPMVSVLMPALTICSLSKAAPIPVGILRVIIIARVRH